MTHDAAQPGSSWLPEQVHRACPGAAPGEEDCKKASPAPIDRETRASAAQRRAAIGNSFSFCQLLLPVMASACPLARATAQAICASRGQASRESGCFQYQPWVRVSSKQQGLKARFLKSFSARLKVVP